MHQKYKEEFISVTELWQDEINELVNSISILKTSNNPLDQRLRWKYEIVIDYLKGTFCCPAHKRLTSIILIVPAYLKSF